MSNVTWHTEYDEAAFPGQRFQLEQEELLYEIKSKFQTIKIFTHKKFGRVLMIDGHVQATTYDEFLYQEMLTFLPLCSTNSPDHVLIIGGGDGGVAREVLKDNRVKHITLVDIDEEVLNASRKYMQTMGEALENERVEILICDAAKYIRDCKTMFDAVIIDLTDESDDGPMNFDNFGPAFYKNLRKCINDGGVIAEQSYSPYSNNDILKHEVGLFRNCADQICYGFVPVPSFPNGNIGVIFGRVNKSDKKQYGNLSVPRYTIPVEEATKMKLRCYYDKYHISCCTLPLEFSQWLYDL